MDLGAKARKWCTAFPTAPGSLEPHHHFVPYPGHLFEVLMQSVYSTTPVYWVNCVRIVMILVIGNVDGDPS